MIQVVDGCLVYQAQFKYVFQAGLGKTPFPTGDYGSTRKSKLLCDIGLLQPAVHAMLP